MMVVKEDSGGNVVRVKTHGIKNITLFRDIGEDISRPNAYAYEYKRKISHDNGSL